MKILQTPYGVMANIYPEIGCPFAPHSPQTNFPSTLQEVTSAPEIQSLPI